MPHARSESFYDVWGNTLKQHLESCFPNIRIKKVGSRNNDTHKRASDLDFQFCMEGGKTKREDIYPKIVDCLRQQLIGRSIQGELIQNIRTGGSGNVVNILPEDGGKISFALMPCESIH